MMKVENGTRAQAGGLPQKFAGRRGFSLAEAVCAMAVLCLTLWGTVECLSCALRYTGETRLHAGDFSRAEAAGLAAVATGNPKAGLQPDVELREASLTRTSDPASGYELKLVLSVYRARAETGKNAASRLKAPSFPVFLPKVSS